MDSELLGSQPGGGDSQDHTHPTAWQSGLQAEMGVQKYTDWTKGQSISVGNVFFSLTLHFVLGYSRLKMLW